MFGYISGTTAWFSICTHFSLQQQVKQLTIAIRDAGSDVVKAKDGDGSATLSMAFAAARFTIALAKAALGEKNIIECAYVQSSVIKVS